MKLEELLGEELFKQVQTKIDEANKDVSDKLKHIRYADLSEGNYVGKAKNLIEQLKKGTKDDENLQGKIADYEQQNTKLQEELYIPTRQSTLHGVLVHDFRRYSARFPVISACGLFRYRYSGFC